MSDSNGSRHIERTLLIDADDTLWENNVYFLRTTARFLDHVAAHGMDPDEAHRVLDACEQELIPTLGYSPQTYITALGLCFQRMAAEAGLEVDDEAVARARAFGDAILDPPMALADSVPYVLRALRRTSRLILVTKGDVAFQSAKIARSGLAPLFDAQHIVREKDPQTFRRIVAEEGLDPANTWMVGNSPRSDINPAVAAGLGAILIPHGNTWTAELEPLERPELVVTLKSFYELLDYFGVDGDCK